MDDNAVVAGDVLASGDDVALAGDADAVAGAALDIGVAGDGVVIASADDHAAVGAADRAAGHGIVAGVGDHHARIARDGAVDRDAVGAAAEDVDAVAAFVVVAVAGHVAADIDHVARGGIEVEAVLPAGHVAGDLDIVVVAANVDAVVAAGHVDVVGRDERIAAAIDADAVAGLAGKLGIFTDALVTLVLDGVVAAVQHDAVIVAVDGDAVLDGQAVEVVEHDAVAAGTVGRGDLGGAAQLDGVVVIGIDAGARAAFDHTVGADEGVVTAFQVDTVFAAFDVAGVFDVVLVAEGQDAVLASDDVAGVGHQVAEAERTLLAAHDDAVAVDRVDLAVVGDHVGVADLDAVAAIFPVVVGVDHAAVPYVVVVLGVDAVVVGGDLAVQAVVDDLLAARDAEAALGVDAVISGNDRAVVADLLLVVAAEQAAQCQAIGVGMNAVAAGAVVLQLLTAFFESAVVDAVDVGVAAGVDQAGVDDGIALAVDLDAVAVAIGVGAGGNGAEVIDAVVGVGMDAVAARRTLARQAAGHDDAVFTIGDVEVVIDADAVALRLDHAIVLDHFGEIALDDREHVEQVHIDLAEAVDVLSRHGHLEGVVSKGIVVIVVVVDAVAARHDQRVGVGLIAGFIDTAAVGVGLVGVQGGEAHAVAAGGIDLAARVVDVAVGVGHQHAVVAGTDDAVVAQVIADAVGFAEDHRATANQRVEHVGDDAVAEQAHAVALGVDFAAVVDGDGIVVGVRVLAVDDDAVAAGDHVAAVLDQDRVSFVVRLVLADDDAVALSIDRAVLADGDRVSVLAAAVIVERVGQRNAVAVRALAIDRARAAGAADRDGVAVVGVDAVFRIAGDVRAAVDGDGVAVIDQDARVADHLGLAGDMDGVVVVGLDAVAVATLVGVALYGGLAVDQQNVAAAQVDTVVLALDEYAIVKGDVVAGARLEDVDTVGRGVAVALDRALALEDEDVVVALRANLDAVGKALDQAALVEGHVDLDVVVARSDVDTRTIPAADFPAARKRAAAAVVDDDVVALDDDAVFLVADDLAVIVDGQGATGGAGELDAAVFAVDLAHLAVVDSGPAVGVDAVVTIDVRRAGRAAGNDIGHIAVAVAVEAVVDDVGCAAGAA